ncbi:hypothetical protein DXG03_002988 [Asterophora parasitica]|uniref:KARI N-terminal Rossmann domain-containing protein n=1 Tax=Asterophora parasitica TaxID=117018 RepID=A0A9P7G7U5_9AGAR|nr:hypothetical protein DXG03_002988 [Asterophora parasitica]
MASLASSASSRVASRRAPCALSKVTPKAAQTASYSVPGCSCTVCPAFHCPARFLLQGTRGVKTLDFAGTEEVVYERSDWPLAKLHDYFKSDTLALIGYGSQGRGQGLNARDNGLDVIVGVRKDDES